MLKVSCLAVVVASFHLLTSTASIVFLDAHKFRYKVGPIEIEYEARPEKEKAPEWGPDVTPRKQRRLHSPGPEPGSGSSTLDSRATSAPSREPSSRELPAPAVTSSAPASGSGIDPDR